MYLITSEGAPAGTTHMSALLQLLNGTVDADRLDYVYRDAYATIGSLSGPNAVIESIQEYKPGFVVVNDPRPVTDFLSTRMRLWTFVYSSADVRFKQILLKTILDGYWDRPEAARSFIKHQLGPNLPFDSFLELDDRSLIARIAQLSPTHLEDFRQRAKELFLNDTMDYESCVLTREPNESVKLEEARIELPDRLFFDLLSDHGQHHLYEPGTVFVRQALTSKAGKSELLRLEESAGAFSPLFKGGNSAILVPNGYYVFIPKDTSDGEWKSVREAIEKNSLFESITWENARRILVCPEDTLNKKKYPNFKEKASIGISYCQDDFPTAARIVRELYRMKRRYRLHIQTPYEVGGTSMDNCVKLIKETDATLAIVSIEYIRRALDGKSHISREVRTMNGREGQMPIVVLGLDERDSLTAVPMWNWAMMDDTWHGKEPNICNDTPLRFATEETLQKALNKAIDFIDNFGGPRHED